jgi:FAD/FMN-containing dehydrogenase/Fe-S oxidoreductase
MEKLAEALRQRLSGEVRDDAISRSVYSVDASIYEIRPDVIALPRTKRELIDAVCIAAVHRVPVIPRGAATGIAGGCIGTGLVLDTSKYLHRILDIDIERRTARCEPGVVQNALNGAVGPFGLRLGPDTSTGNRATLGGMLANNSAGARSLRYGKMVDHIQEVELLLANGELLQCKALTDDELRAKLALNSREGEIYREVLQIKQTYAADIAERMPHLPRRASGYCLDELLKPGPLNLSQLVAGSEGSLGIIAEMRVGLVSKPQRTALCLLQLHSLEEAFSAVTAVLEWKPLAVELIDDKIVAAGRQSPALRQRTDWIVGQPKAVLIVEFEEAAPDALQQKCAEFVAFAKKQALGYAAAVMTDAKPMSDVWAVRESGLGLLLSKRQYNRAFSFLEDVAVSPQQLPAFMGAFLQLLRAHGKEAGVYGHVGAGCMHVRPYMDLRDPQELALMEQLMRDTTQLLIHHRGALSGEHGDGLVRSWLNEALFGPRVYEAFCRLKRAFDPEGRMNPGKVVATQSLTENLRLSPTTQSLPLETFLDFSREGGIHLAADLCNGNGMCRKREGLMCPSFQAYGDEFHTTRARAQSFRDLLNRRLPANSLSSPEMYHVLEYCLECKGCKTECPSQVDMAKMKAEFLYHYQKKHGVGLRSRLFGHLGSLYALMSPLAGLSNRIAQSFVAKWILKRLGVASQRPLPALATERFSRWFARQPVDKRTGQQQVVLFNDTYTEFLHPEIGQAAVHILRTLGYEVLVPPWSCCGRPLISKGMLPQARRKAQALVDQMGSLPIIVLEPSCLSALRDDYRDLLPGTQVNALSLEEFLSKGSLALPWRTDLVQTRVWVHTHCHQKALMGTEAARAVLAAVPGVQQVTDLVTGCCGLAGSFGYEAEHYEFSMAIAEKTVFAALRQAQPEDVIVANGMSCRSQIAHGSTRVPIHLAQFIAERAAPSGLGPMADSTQVDRALKARPRPGCI